MNHSEPAERKDPHAPFLEIQGGRSLAGQVLVPGAKNAALPSIVAACLSEEPTVLHKVPTGLNDVKLLIELLCSLGVVIEEPVPGTLICSGRGWQNRALDGKQVGRLRHSLLLLGAAAYRHSHLLLPLPGGCKLGSRRHDLHLLALRTLGFEVTETEAGIELGSQSSPGDKHISFYHPTFGGTLNTLFAASGCEGTTLLENAAADPEVLDVIELLRSMGADISWADETTLKIRGAKLRGTEHTVMGDRIVVSTLIAATAVTRGHTFIQGATTKVLKAETAAWRSAGLLLEESEDGLEVKAPERLNAVSVRTRAYPGFHTDIQPMHAAMMLQAEGETLIEETILDGRFRYAQELQKMGASLETEDADFLCVNGVPGQQLRIKGVEKLHGAQVEATDIRGGAAVVAAALAAEGTTRVTNLYQLERGYHDISSLLSPLGAQVKRVGTPDIKADASVATGD